MNTITYIPVDDIVYDSKQPRKFFDEKALEELTESIKEVGILQPILVQPGVMIGTGHKTPQRPGYTIICGQRRYMAAWKAGLTEVPAIIRENLSPSEVLEIQIVENLQRKDVNPMEEAIAFDRLNNTFSIEEIANRVGKSATYVAQRISLTNLTDGWQQIVYNGGITLTLAYKLARMGKESQQEAYKEVVNKDGKLTQWAEGRLENMVDEDDHNLDEAPFDITDEEIHPQAGACTTCRYNSANQPLLFADLNAKQICHNSVCFSIKESKGFMKKVAELQGDPNMLFVSRTYGYDQKEKALVKELEASGITVLQYDDYEVIEEPIAPESWEEYLDEQKENEEWDEMGEREQEESLGVWMKDYKEYEQEYQKDLAEYQEHSKTARDAFIVMGYKKGQVVKVRLKKGAKKAAQKNEKADPLQAEILELDTEIQGIEDREKRNQELDREKVYKQLVDMLKAEDGSFLSSQDYITGAEIEALILAMAQNYSVKDALENASKSDYGYTHYTLWKDLIKAKDINKTLAVAARHFILSTLVSSMELDPNKYGKAAALQAIAEQYMPTTVEKLAMDQQEKATKRKANLNKRLTALREKRAQLEEQIRINKDNGQDLIKAYKKDLDKAKKK